MCRKGLHLVNVVQNLQDFSGLITSHHFKYIEQQEGSDFLQTSDDHAIMYMCIK